MYGVHGPRDASPDGQGSMEERNVQNLNLPQDLDEPYTSFEGERIGLPGITGNSDAQPSNFFWCEYFHPYCCQADHYHVHFQPHLVPLASSPAVLLPEQNPEANVQMTHSPDISGRDLGDEFANVQILANGSRTGEHITDQNFLPGPNSPFNHWNGNDVQLHDSNLSNTVSYGHSSHVSPHQSEYMPDTHPESRPQSPFEHHPRQEVEAPAVGEPQPIPQTEIAQTSKNGVVRSKKHPCPYPGCKTRCGRDQEVRRHVREIHEIEISPRCFACGKKWTRPAVIREHLITEHRGLFTKERRQEIRRLRGLNDTIDFLESL